MEALAADVRSAETSEMPPRFPARRTDAVDAITEGFLTRDTAAMNGGNSHQNPIDADIE